MSDLARILAIKNGGNMNIFDCRICNNQQTHVDSINPNLVCPKCVERAVDSFHRPVVIARKVTRTKYDIELGEVLAFNRDSNDFDAETATINREVSNKRICFIDGVAVQLFEEGAVVGLVVLDNQADEEIKKVRDRQTQPCGVCKQPVHLNQRYPAYVCGRCQSRAVDSLHRPVITSNTGILGTGQIALLRDKPDGATEYVPSEPANENYEIYIDGVKCNFEEARFGGIVVQPANRKRLGNPFV